MGMTSKLLTKSKTTTKVATSQNNIATTQSPHEDSSLEY